MSFAVSADAYDRFMGRYSTQLAPRFADFAGVQRGQRALDVGCGPGALTSELVTRLGAESVAAVDPSESFVTAARERHPEVDFQRAAAEELPFPDAEFDVALAQLVVHFIADPVLGLREMARVTRPGGVVVACVWDNAGGRGPLSLFWTAARQLDPDAEDESGLAGARKGHLAELLDLAGLRDVYETDLAIPRHPCDVRRLVGAVHAGSRSRRRICGRTRHDPAREAEGALQAARSGRALHPRGKRVGRARPRLVLDRGRMACRHVRRACAARDMAA